MKTLIIYQSIHHGNTEKIAKKIGEVLGAELKKPSEVKPEDLANYDLIGLGSGIYAWRFHGAIIKLINSLPEMPGKNFFVFSTHGSGTKKSNQSAIQLLKDKNFNVVGDFQCRGFDTWGPFGLIGGMNKGRPNEKDFSAAADFAKGLKPRG